MMKLVTKKDHVLPCSKRGHLFNEPYNGSLGSLCPVCGLRVRHVFVPWRRRMVAQVKLKNTDVWQDLGRALVPPCIQNKKLRAPFLRETRRKKEEKHE